MGKYRTQTLFMCPYCSAAGFFRRGQRDAHIKKSHPGEKEIKGTGWDETLKKLREKK